jgi:potassium-dependent mechanosensitive channel
LEDSQALFVVELTATYPHPCECWLNKPTSSRRFTVALPRLDLPRKELVRLPTISDSGLFSLLKLLLPKYFVLLAFLLAILSPAGAQTLGEQQAVLDGIVKRADSFPARVADKAGDDAELAKLRVELQDLARDVLAVAVSFRPRLTAIGDRLTSLGPPPSESEVSELPAVQAERRNLEGEKKEINALLGESAQLSQRINGLADEVAARRRQLFSNSLAQRVDVNFAFGSEVSDAAGNEVSALARQFSSWSRFVWKFRYRDILTATLLALLAAVVIVIGGRRLVGDLYRRDPQLTEPTYLSRLSVGFWSTLIPSISVAVFLAATYLLFDYFNVLRSDVRPTIAAAFNVVAIVYFINRLARALFSPDLPSWQLIRAAPNPARILTWLITAAALVRGLDFIGEVLNESLDSPLSLTIAKSLVSIVLVGALILAIAFVNPIASEEDGKPRPWPRAVRILLVLLSVLPMIAAVFGYVGLARFVSQQIVVTGAILVTMYLGFQSARALSEEGAFANTSLGRALQEQYKVEPVMLGHAGVFTSVLMNLLVLSVGIPLILLQWRFQWADIRSWIITALTGFQVGSVTISVIGIFVGILVFFVGYLITRWFQRWLDGNILTRGKVDSGVRNSIKTALGYAGTAIAGLIGISVAGIDLSNLALVAGALSLGIGFGLQNIVSNFVSGLILLAERPFKVGDWIEAGGTSGIVKKISVRATEIETFHKQTVMLPNSVLINAAVGNWTHRNKLGRIDIPVGISYKSDPKLAQSLLLDIGKQHPLIMKNPEPFVLFQGFGDNRVNFELRVHLMDITNSALVQTELRNQILSQFAANNIEIPAAA